MVLNLIIEKLTKRRVDRILEKVVADMKNGKEITDEDLTRLEDKKNGIIDMTNSGFKIISSKGSIHVDWDKVDKIVSFKRDLWTTDQVCLGFVEHKKESMIVVHEEMKGFFNLCREIKVKKPCFEERYYEWLLSTPAFDGTLFTLWEDTRKA
jgi:hypothetical protein